MIMKRQILIVDDSEVNRSVLRRILGEEYAVLEAENGERALELLRLQSKSVSVVLLDILMPVLDGYGVLEAMREDDELSQIPVIVTTGSDEVSSEEKALALGALDFIVKPYSPAVIRHRIENTIKLRETSALVNSASIDELTGLYNRAAFIERAAQLIAEREPGYYVIACFDIDSFKVLNDQYGSAIGDHVLSYIADVFRKGFEPLGGICCRVMADNFAVLYPASYMSSKETARIRRAAAQLDGSVPPITFSIGRYIVDDLSLPVSAMYDRASIAESSVKARYDAEVALYDESMRERLLEQQEIVNDMNSALARGEFEVWFQPQFNHASGALVGSEALVRWRHPKKGLIAPNDFIPVFERNGFIYELDRFVWKQTCAQLRSWLDEGLEPLSVSVNVSRYDLLREGFVDFISSLVERYELPADLLRIEITESAFAQSSERIIEVVQRLIDSGFTVEIDDFGSGYSSFNTLKDVPATVLKIDMKFLERGDNSSRGGNILESIVRMGKWLGMTVVAEGVETIQQADYLKSIGCIYMQGFLFSKPLDKRDYEKLIMRGVKEERQLSLEVVEALDNNAFWSPNSMETLIFNSFTGGACIFEYTNGGVEMLRINDKYAVELIGGNLPSDTALNLQIADYMDDESRASFLLNIARAIDTNDEATCEIMLCDLPDKPGNTFLRITMRVIARTGERRLLYASVHNITEQREAERKEREISEQFREIMRNINGGVTAASINDVNGVHYIFANEQYYDMLGYTKAQFDSEVVSPFEVVHPDDRERVIWETFRGNESGEPFTCRFRAMRRDGDVIWIQSNISITSMSGVNGPVQLAVANDITEQLEAERSAKESSEQLRVIMENMNGGVSAVTFEDGAVNFIFANERYYSILGYTHEQFDSEVENAMDIVLPADREKIEKIISNILSDRLPQSYEYRCIRRDGSIIDMRCNASVTSIAGESGTVLLSVTNDITAENESAAQLGFLNEVARELLATPDVAAALERVLRRTLEYFAGDRSYVIELDHAKQTSDNTYEVCADGVSSEMARLQGVPRSVSEEWWTTGAEDYIRVSDVAGVADGDGKSILEAQDINSLVAMPLRRDGAVIGFVGVDNPRERLTHLAQLRAIGDFIAVMLTRRDLTAKIVSDGRVLSTLMNETPGGFARMRIAPDGSGETLYVNDGYCALLGMTREEVYSMLSEDFYGDVYPDDVSAVRAAIQKAAETDGRMNARFRLRRRDSTQLWVQCSGSVSGDGQGGLILNGYYNDITEREKLELSYRDMLPVALSAMLETSADLSFVKDSSSVYVCCSLAFAKMVGLDSAAQIAGKTDYDLFDKELADKYLADDRKLIEGGVSLVDYEEELPDEDGLMRYSLTSKFLLFDSFGSVIGLYGTGRDITETREAKARLEIVTNNPQCGLAMYEHTPGGSRLLYFSDGFFSFSGYTREEYAELTKSSPFALVFEEDAPYIREEFERLIRGEHISFDRDYRCRQKDGGYRWFSLRGSVSDRRGDSVIINTMKFDITERMLAEEALRVRNAEYSVSIAQSGRLIYRYSHKDNSIEMPRGTAELFGMPVRVDNMPAGVLETDRIASESAAEYADFFERIKRGDATGTMTVRRRVKDGSYRWFAARFSNIYGADGRPVSAIIVLEDVTDERAERIGGALDRARLVTALRTVYPVMMSVNITQNTFTTLAGGERLTVEDASHGTLDELVSAGIELMPEIYAKAFAEKFSREALLNSLKGDGDAVRLEYQQKLLDGKLHWLETVALRVDNAFGDDATGIMLCRVIDTQKANEDALKNALRLNNEELTRKRIYQNVLDDSMPVGTLILRLSDGVLLHIGGTFTSLLGYSIAEMRAFAKTGFEGFVFDSDIGERFISYRGRGDNPPANFEQEYRVLKKDGSLVWIYEKGTLVDIEGEPCYIVVCMDVTAQRTMENRLSTSEQELRVAMSEMGKIIMIYDVEADALTLPQEYADTHALPTVIKNVSRSDSLAGAIDAGSYSRYIGAFADIKSGLEAGGMEYLVAYADGSRHWERAGFSTIFDSDGKPVKAVIAVEDTTREHMIGDENEALRASEQILQVVAKHSNRLVFQYDLATGDMRADAEAAARVGFIETMSNVPESAIASGLVMPESVNDARAVFAAIHAGIPSGGAKLHLRRHSGDTLWVDMQYSLVYTDSDSPVSAVLSFLDINENHEKELAYDRYRQSVEMGLESTGYLVYLEADLTTGITEKQGGSMLPKDFPAAGGSRTETIEHIVDYYVDEGERARCREFFSRDHLVTAYSDGVRNISEDWSITLPDGKPGFFRSELQMIQDPYSGHIKVYTILRDVSEEKLAALNVQKRAETDGMTELYNKTTTEALIAQRLERADGTPCALLVGDLDNLKGINDNYGHAQGDRAIQTMAKTLRSQFRATDIVGRVGGDEFAVFLDGEGNEARLRTKMATFMKKLSTMRVGEAGNVPLRGSVGIAIGKTGETSYEQLFNAADRALYHVKRNGKNDFAIYTPEMENDTYRYVSQSHDAVWRASVLGGEELGNLLSAVAVLYPLVISVNLTQNSYYMLKYDGYSTTTCYDEGSFDELIATGAGTFHPDDRQSFLDSFTRAALLAAYKRGEKHVSHVGRQLGDDGAYHLVETDVVLLKPNENGDILELSFARELPAARAAD